MGGYVTPYYKKVMQNDMSGVKGKSGPAKNNKNAVKHGFYADALTDEEHKLYEAAQLATLGDEVAVSRIKLNRLLVWMQTNEVKDSTLDRMDRMMSRVGDLEVKRSIIERNAAESGQGNNDDFDRFVDVATRTGAHRTTFKPNGRTNGKTNGS